MRLITLFVIGALAVFTLSEGDSIAAIAATPAGAPTTEPSAEVTSVHRGDIRLDIHADGYFEPDGATEIRIDPKAYFGELKIAAIVANGARIKTGDTVLRIAADDFDRQLAAAQNDARLASANLDKSKSDVALGEKADLLSMNMQKEHLAEAYGAVAWWEKVDGPIQLTIADYSAREADYQLEDSKEQLDELKKMYKSEELTNETTDIVMKRAEHDIELGKISDSVDHEQADEFEKFHYDFLHKQVADNAAAAGQLTSELQAQQAQSKIARETALVSAQQGNDAAVRKVNELLEDQKLLSFAAPADGIVLYGQLTAGNWQNNDEQSLRVGQSIQAKQVILTLFVPGKIRGTVDLTEAQFFSVPIDANAEVSLTAFPGTMMTGVCQHSVPQGRATQSGIQYSLHIKIPKADPRIFPGMRAGVSIHSDLAKNVLIMPLSAVDDGQVWVRDVAGKVEAKDVTLGASDSSNIEVLSGLTEGDLVLTKAKK